jgi:murein DD-endopeptidase MepM/ murein hydrolase activator NlpD
MYVQAALIAGKHWKKIVLTLTLMFILIFIFFFSYQEPKEPEYEGGGVATVSPLVLRYQPLVEKYAVKYGVESYVPLLLAKIMQESGGRVPDVMQSSESLGLPPNTIKDPEWSIDVGVKYFSGILKDAKGDVKLALQSYNFGSGYIKYALEHGGGYSKESAVAFSNMMAKKNGWDRYGDVNYVDNVLRYLSGGGGGSAGPVNSFGFVKPILGSITSNFGFRFHPITGIPKLHAGTDFSCGQKPVPIYATKAGKVVKAGWQDPNNHKAGYGQRVVIKHSDGLESVYAHLSKFMVKNGQTVTQGQQIGNCGTTGSSTGMHLHFELVFNGQKKDPAPYLN